MPDPLALLPAQDPNESGQHEYETNVHIAVGQPVSRVGLNEPRHRIFATGHVGNHHPG